MYLMRFIVQVISQNQKDVLEKYKDTNYVWLDDRIDYCRDGDAVGLRTFCMDCHIIEIMKATEYHHGRSYMTPHLEA